MSSKGDRNPTGNLHDPKTKTLNPKPATLSIRVGVPWRDHLLFVLVFGGV